MVKARKEYQAANYAVKLAHAYLLGGLSYSENGLSLVLYSETNQCSRYRKR